MNNPVEPGFKIFYKRLIDKNTKILHIALPRSAILLDKFFLIKMLEVSANLTLCRNGNCT